jgi:hypothetical protein
MITPFQGWEIEFSLALRFRTSEEKTVENFGKQAKYETGE